MWGLECSIWTCPETWEHPLISSRRPAPPRPPVGRPVGCAGLLESAVFRTSYTPLWPICRRVLGRYSLSLIPCHLSGPINPCPLSVNPWPRARAVTGVTICSRPRVTLRRSWRPFLPSVCDTWEFSSRVVSAGYKEKRGAVKGLVPAGILARTMRAHRDRWPSPSGASTVRP